MQYLGSSSVSDSQEAEQHAGRFGSAEPLRAQLPLPLSKPEPRIVPWYDAEAAVAETTADRFWGATIQLFHVEVLVVLVSMRVIGDRREAPIAVGAFQSRFGRTIVLAAQGRDGRPMYFGPAAIARVLGQIPFDALAWKRYRLSRPKPLMLPIPVDPPPESRVSWSDLHVIPGRKPPPDNTTPGRRRASNARPEPRSTRALGDAPRRTRGLSEAPKNTRALDVPFGPSRNVTDDVPWSETPPEDSRNKPGFSDAPDACRVQPELSYLRTAVRDHEHEETRP